MERVLEDMRVRGAPASAIETARARLEPEAVDPVLEIHPRNVAAVKALIAMGTQWVAVGVGTMSRAQVIRTGLNYAALEPTLRMAGLDLTPDDFGRLRVLEAGCLEAWNEERGRGQ